MTATIKYGKGYEAPWAVFHGSPSEVREDMVEAFGLDEEFVKSLTVSELIINVSQLALGKGNVAAMLGGVAIGPADEAQSSGPSTPAPSAPAKAEEPSSQNDYLLKKVAETADTKALKQLYAENQPAFAGDTVLMDAWKARGKALQSAAAA